MQAKRTYVFFYMYPENMNVGYYVSDASRSLCFLRVDVVTPKASSLIPNVGVRATSELPKNHHHTHRLRAAAFSRASPGHPTEAGYENASDSAASEYHSFSDSDAEDDEAAMTEEERKLEREMRAVERQLVLEAAGIVVKKDETRPRPRSHHTVASVRPKHRPAPALQLRHTQPGSGSLRAAVARADSP